MPILIQKKLPEDGIEGLDDLAAYPFLNLLLHRDNPNKEDQDGLFPAQGLCHASSSKGFLDWLGPPLAIAHDLEASPGVWWLQDTDHGLDWVVYSDCHRVSRWKGGQLCVGAMDGATIHLSHPGIVAMRQAVARAWGIPPPGLGSFLIPEWFNHRASHRKIAPFHTLFPAQKGFRP